MHISALCTSQGLLLQNSSRASGRRDACLLSSPVLCCWSCGLCRSHQGQWTSRDKIDGENLSCRWMLQTVGSSPSSLLAVLEASVPSLGEAIASICRAGDLQPSATRCEEAPGDMAIRKVRPSSRRLHSHTHSISQRLSGRGSLEELSSDADTAEGQDDLIRREASIAARVIVRHQTAAVNLRSLG